MCRDPTSVELPILGSPSVLDFIPRIDFVISPNQASEFPIDYWFRFPGPNLSGDKNKFLIEPHVLFSIWLASTPSRLPPLFLTPYMKGKQIKEIV
jgi:hypothetical protein